MHCTNQAHHINGWTTPLNSIPTACYILITTSKRIEENNETNISLKGSSTLQGDNWDGGTRTINKKRSHMFWDQFFKGREREREIIVILKKGLTCIFCLTKTLLEYSEGSVINSEISLVYNLTQSQISFSLQEPHFSLIVSSKTHLLQIKS